MRYILEILAFLFAALVQGCQRPDGTIGVCVNLNECPSVLGLAQGIITPDDLIELQQLTCDGNHTEAVCCEMYTPIQMNHNTDTGNIDVEVEEDDKDVILPGKNVCGRNSVTIGMFDGVTGAHPWTALLQYREEDFTPVGPAGRFRCSGALINHRYVITLANCVFKIKAVNIRLGEYNLLTDPDCISDNICADPVLDVGVDLTIVHPHYTDRPYFSDLALIRLRHAVAYTKFISPICMPSTVGLLYSVPGTILTSSGWNIFGNKTQNVDRRKTEVTVTDWHKCKELYQSTAGHLTIDSTIMCASNVISNGTCVEGVGGPMVLMVGQHWTIEGLSAGGAPCWLKLHSTLFTHIPKFDKWIRETIQRIEKEMKATDIPGGDICGRDTETNGGIPAELTDFPWMALLQYEFKKTGKLSFECSGSLINHRYVLTAAHCITRTVDDDSKIVNIRLGEYDTRSDPDCIQSVCADPVVNVGVEKIVLHPQIGNKRNDIALIRMQQKVEYTDYISPICMPWVVGLMPSPPQTQLTAAGWAQSRNNSRNPIKAKVRLPVFDQRLCKNKYRAIRTTIVSSQLCAGGQRDIDTCNGDSGGPLAVRQDMRWTIEGIVSYSIGCGSEGWPAVYTRVARFEHFIRTTIKP